MSPCLKSTHLLSCFDYFCCNLAFPKVTWPFHLWINPSIKTSDIEPCNRGRIAYWLGVWLPVEKPWIWTLMASPCRCLRASLIHTYLVLKAAIESRVENRFWKHTTQKISPPSLLPLPLCACMWLTDIWITVKMDSTNHIHLVPKIRNVTELFLQSGWQTEDLLPTAPYIYLYIYI